MNGRKFFGIGAAILIILTVFVPVANSISVVEDKNECKSSDNKGFRPLLNLGDLAIKKFEPILKTSIYNLPFNTTFETEKSGRFRCWAEYYYKVDKTAFLRSDWTEFTNTKEIESSLDIPIKSWLLMFIEDEDRYFASRIVDSGMQIEFDDGSTIELEGATFVNPFINSTATQLLGSLPSFAFEYPLEYESEVDSLLLPRLIIKNKEKRLFESNDGSWLNFIGNLWNVIRNAIKDGDLNFVKDDGSLDWSEIDAIWEAASDAIKNEFLPFIFKDMGSNLKNHRFGWMKENLWYIFNITIDVLNIFENIVVMVGEVWQYIEPIVQIINHGIQFFISVFSGVPDFTQFNQMITILNEIIVGEDFLNAIWTFIGEGKEIIALYGILSKDIENFKDWKSTSPWKEPITVNVDVDYVEDGETLTVEVFTIEKNKEKSLFIDDFKDNTNDEKTGKLTIPPISIETKNMEEPKDRHLIMIRVDGDKHKKTLVTEYPVFWHCYSDGTVYNRFEGFGDDDEDDDSVCFDVKTNSLFNQLFSNFPIIQRLLGFFKIQDFSHFFF